MTPVAEEIDRIQGTVKPAGYRILIRIPNLNAQMKLWADLIMPEETRRLEEQAQLVGQVIEIGPDAYADKAKFPNGPWCQKGDFVMIRAYAGTRFVMRDPNSGIGTLYCLINDDTVQGIVPGGVEVERPT